MPYLINAAQLEKFRKNPKNVIILDATWRIGKVDKTAHEEFLETHIAGARFLDLGLFCDRDACHSKMITRDESQIAHILGDLGVTNEHKIILYDNSPMRTSCRALWMLKLFGHAPDLIYILDGGLPAWHKFAGKVESGSPKSTTPKIYEATYQAQYIRTLAQMKSNLHQPKEQVIDVRHPVRYAGGPEDREGLRSGHIPGSYSFPFAVLFDEDGTFKSLERLRTQMSGVGIDFNYPIVTTCGSGTTAPILNFILDLLGQAENAVYNGSWTEWGADQLYHGETSLDERPVETSLDR